MSKLTKKRGLVMLLSVGLVGCLDQASDDSSNEEVAAENITLGGVTITVAPAQHTCTDPTHGLTPLWHCLGNEPDSFVPVSQATMYKNQYMEAIHHSHRLVMQADGNLVLYRILATGGLTATWSTGTTGANNRVVMQSDGNLVVYNASNQALWQSHTFVAKTVWDVAFAVQDDGNLAIYKSTGDAAWTALWQSGTAGR
jgi:hypothetical protein